MLKVSEIKAIIPDAMEQFFTNLRFNQQIRSLIEATPITVCNRKNCIRIYEEAIQRQGSYNTGFSNTASAEVIWGVNGSEILVYQHRFNSIAELKKALWHEWGHVVANQFTTTVSDEIMEYHRKRKESANPIQYDESLPADERRYYEDLNYGFRLWNEFIAEVVSNYALSEEPRSIAWDKQQELHYKIMSVITVDSVQQDILGHYCAMVLSDATVYAHLLEDSHFSIGLELLQEDFSNVIEGILHILDEQLTKDNYFEIDKSTIMQLGGQVNILWDLRYNIIRGMMESMLSDL